MMSVLNMLCAVFSLCNVADLDREKYQRWTLNMQGWYMPESLAGHKMACLKNPEGVTICRFQNEPECLPKKCPRVVWVRK